MAKNLPQISAEYKKEVTQSVILVFVFFFIYALLIGLSIALVVLLGYFALQIVQNLGFRYYSIIIAAGIFGMGLFILVFLIKFIFSSFKSDDSSLIEINRTHEPKLFQLIDEVVKEVGTQQPKKVFLSPDVNAYVSYNSSFWSMILPVRKNLTIGLGLINTTSISELKGILAHEFGHFSQRSMKVGSYVNQANKIIHSTLYDNEGFDNTINSFASLNAIIYFFAKLSYLVITGIKWILQKTYEFLYKKHLSLSRQMEFHADAIAATVVGSKVHSDALLRIDLSGSALDNAVAVYLNSEVKCNTKNIFENQKALTQFYSTEFKYPLKNELPQITLSDLQRFDQSKLFIEDQWSSHPTMKQRVQFIEKMAVTGENVNDECALTLLNHTDKISERLTQKFLAANGLDFSDAFISNEEFMLKFKTKETEFKFPDVFNNYYNTKNPLLKPLQNLSVQKEKFVAETFFNDEQINLVYEKSALEGELQTLELIKNKEIPVKTFDYDGKKYLANQAEKVRTLANERLLFVTAEIEKNDENILNFLSQIPENETKEKLKEKIQKYLEMDAAFEKYNKSFQDFVPGISFMSEVLPFDTIRKKRFELIEKEKEFKNVLIDFSQHSIYTNNLTTEEAELFKQFVSKENKYFEFDKYLEDEVQILSNVLDAYTTILSRNYINVKKDLLKFEAKIFEKELNKSTYSEVLTESSSN